MSTLTRRGAIGLSALGALGVPTLSSAQTRPTRARTVRAVIPRDIGPLDPVSNTSLIAYQHGAMVYDTLLAMDERQQVQPQMASRYAMAADRLSWIFDLREGLTWSDGTPVTAADAIPSIRRWARRSTAGQHLLPRIEDIVADGDRSFTIKLKEPYGSLPEALAAGIPPCVIMRRAEAVTDPFRPVPQVLGSGPFTYNRAESQVGRRYVYDRRADYRPRSEAPSGFAGGKVVKVDRVILEVFSDPQTAAAALQAGEVDFVQQPPIELLDQLEGDRNIRIQVLETTGLLGNIRLNHLHPPFNNVACRRALLHIVNQEEMLRPSFGGSRYARTCGSYFACGGAMENDANTEWFRRGPDLTRARALLTEGGYNGAPVVLLHTTDLLPVSNAGIVLANALRQAGMTVQVQSMDAAMVSQRTQNKSPPGQGGWNLYLHAPSAIALDNPFVSVTSSAAGERGWTGWPSDARHEELRSAWAAADSAEERKQIARTIQENAWDFVPQVYFGQWTQPVAHRANLRGFLTAPYMTLWWNVQKG
jgi:peptide/nickel transport system substrate-binding protein